MVTSVLVCDDHPLFRSGVVNCLADNPELKIVGEASDGEACIAKLELFEPDILIIDLSIPGIDGFQVLAWINEQDRSMRVYVLSMHTDKVYVQKARDLGARGFIAKEDAQSELLAAIGHADGEFYTSESIGRQSRNYLPALKDDDIVRALRSVSDAERRVLLLLTESMTSREIAEQLGLSTRTVQAHRMSLAEKLDAKGHNKLLEIAITHRGIISKG